MKRPSLGVRGILDLPELTGDALEFARWNPEVGCLVDRVHPGRPLVLGFGFADWGRLPTFDFFGRTKKLEARAGARFNRILARDVGNDWYHRGVPGLGTHADEVATTLRGLVHAIRPSRVAVVGQSMGGYAAILFGMLLGADRIVAFCPLSHLDPEEAARSGDRRFLPVLESLASDPPKSGYYDLERLGESLDYRGRLHIVFGADPGADGGESANLDAIHALRLARLPNVTLYPYPEAGHAVVQWLADRGQIDDLLARFLLDEETAPAPSPPPQGGGQPLLYRDPKLTICEIAQDHPANRTGRPVTFAAAGAVDPTATRKMDDEQRRWIVENLLLGSSPDDLATALLPHGVSRRETLREVDLARFHPFFLGSKRVVSRLEKRDWLLATYRKLARMRRRSAAIDRLDRPTPGVFLERHESTGRPAVLRGLMDDWPARRSWAFQGLARRFGGLRVGLEGGGDPPGPDRVASLGEFLGSLGDRDEGAGRFSLVAAEGTENRAALADLWADLGPPPEFLASRYRPGGTLWIGPAGSGPSEPDAGAGLLVAQVLGRARATVVPWWDVLLVQEDRRPAADRVEANAGEGHRPPLDRPEPLLATLEPGDFLFLPAGCLARIEALEPSAIVTFDRSSCDEG